MAREHFIAVVDDDQSVRDAVTNLFRSMGCPAVAFACVREKAMSLGAVCFLTKPFNENDLVDGLKSALTDRD
jgi:FixJ family two-component response regulator